MILLLSSLTLTIVITLYYDSSHSDIGLTNTQPFTYKITLTLTPTFNFNDICGNINIPVITARSIADICLFLINVLTLLQMKVSPRCRVRGSDRRTQNDKVQLMVCWILSIRLVHVIRHFLN